MHGTWVNGTRIPVGQDITIHTGDMLTFGTEVTRGAGKSSLQSLSSLLPASALEKRSDSSA